MSEEDLEKSLETVGNFSDGAAEVIFHPIKSARYWSTDNYMKKLGKLRATFIILWE